MGSRVPGHGPALPIRQPLLRPPFRGTLRASVRKRIDHVASQRKRLSPPVRPAGPGLHPAAQPRIDGLDAHRPGGSRPRLPAAGGLFRRTRRGRRRPDRHRWLRAECSGLVEAVRRQAVLAVGSTPAPPAHRRRAPARREDLPSAAACRPLCLPPFVGGAVEAEGTDQPVHPARALGQRRRAPYRRLRTQREAGPRGRLRRRGSDGLGGLPHQRVHRPAHQQAHRCLGWRRAPAHALRGGDRAPYPRGLRPGLHHHLPPVAGGSGGRRQQLGRDRAAGAGDRGGRRNDHQFRHRLARSAHPDHRHLGAARCLRRGHRQAQATCESAAGGDQPHQHARRRRAHPRRWRRRHGVAGAAAAGRPAVAEQGPCRPRRGDQHLHRLQPGLPGPRVREQAGQLPGQPARRARDRAGLPPHHYAEEGCRGRCRPRRPGLCHRRCPARPPGHPVRCQRGDRRAVQRGQAHPRQGRVLRDPALLPPHAAGDRRAAAPRHPC